MAEAQGARPTRGGTRLEESVYSELLDAIRNGTFSLGQRLPSENELASDYGVSRPVVRTALARLREDGLIVSKQGAGSFVSVGPPKEGAGYEPLGSIDDIAAYFRFRRFVETETAALAAARATAADIAELRGYIADMQDLAEAGTATVEPDLAFHFGIAKLSDNRFLLETMKMLRPHMLFIGKFVRSLGRTGYAKGKRDMSSEHQAIVDALEAGDAAAARAAMSAHIDGSENRVFKGE
ncbi:FadR/GntR family transcriptional regulator [Mameliella alba]|uniref:Transcriptional regulator, GntR family protein n=1 Tax=Mameliella alba TaxID=561184 RepID=A0A0B3S1S3_9RHOB|nr:FCD domain-containing protein [Mameliella alba]KHQ52878.1 Transcriptional regulator, GntR family protein [Mameliella alba]